MTVCEACGQPVAAPETHEPEPTDPRTAFLALLTDGERSRGARNLHELSPSRQVEVRAALGLKAAKG